MAKITFSENIEEVRVELNIGKQKLQDFLKSLPPMETEDEYIEAIRKEYAVPAEGQGVDADSEEESREKAFMGRHPITKEEVYR